MIACLPSFCTRCVYVFIVIYTMQYGYLSAVYLELQMMVKRKSHKISTMCAVRKSQNKLKIPIFLSTHTHTHTYRQAVSQLNSSPTVALHNLHFCLFLLVYRAYDMNEFMHSHSYSPVMNTVESVR